MFHFYAITMTFNVKVFNNGKKRENNDYPNNNFIERTDIQNWS